MDKNEFFSSSETGNAQASSLNNAKYIKTFAQPSDISIDKLAKHRNTGFKRNSISFVIGTAIITYALIQSPQNVYAGISQLNKATNTSDILKDVSNAVVSINASNENETLFNAPLKSAGSGIVYLEDEEKIYILTNYHVIKDATNVSVSVDDTTVFPAHYLGGKKTSDLAVIYVNKSEMPSTFSPSYSVATFADSDEINLGEDVIAIGNALGEGKIATSGIVSSVNKNINVDGVKLNVIQTDAAINPGNSGGALVNSKGEVIGVNTAKLSTTGVEGMGYSIKSNDAKEIADKIIQGEDLEAMKLGIEGIEITDDLKEIYDINTKGMYVQSVEEGSNAENAGLKTGDIIVGFGDKKITNLKELDEAVATSKPGEEVNIYIYRDNTQPLILQASMQRYVDNVEF